MTMTIRKLDRATLERVTKVITHTYPGAACPDGTAAALLLNDVLEGVPVEFLAHGTEAYEQLKAHEGMLFVDITPPVVRVSEFVDAGAIVLDHHDKQRDIVERFGARGVYSDEPGVSGAMLAFEHVWSYSTTTGSDSYERAQHFAHLAGVRDTWQTKHDDWSEACAQAEALRFYPWASLKAVDSPFSADGDIRLGAMLRLGPILIAKRKETVKRLVAESWGSETSKGSKLMVVGSVETSDVAEAVGDAADYVIGFQYRSTPVQCTLTLSMRSHTGRDVGAFAKSLGGGGHKAAAGATIPVEVEDKNPYVTIYKLVQAFEATA